MKIVDSESKGNAVRFHLGEDPGDWGICSFKQAAARKGSRRICMNADFKEEDSAGYSLLQGKAYAPLA